MNRDSLTTAQAEQLCERIGNMLAYLGKMKDRMEHLRFPHDDVLYRDTVAAFNALHGLRMELHYLSCKSGVARVQRE